MCCYVVQTSKSMIVNYNIFLKFDNKSRIDTAQQIQSQYKSHDTAQQIAMQLNNQPQQIAIQLNKSYDTAQQIAIQLNKQLNISRYNSTDRSDIAQQIAR